MEIKYNNAIVNIQGKVDREKIEEATIIFMQKVIRETNQNGNKHTSGTIKEKPILAE